MTLQYKPKSSYEKFGVKVYNVLVENFSQTYFVGGMVRDLLLQRRITDIDIATSALPDQVTEAFDRAGITYSISHQKFGVISAQSQQGKVEIAIFRQDLASNNRYPKVRFVRSPKVDSQRRDFTINALYYGLKTKKVLDFHKGLIDLKKRRLRFIGQPVKRIQEDPLRIIRALRFKIQLGLKLEIKTQNSIEKYFPLIKKLSPSRIETEIMKLPLLAQQKSLRRIINS